METTTYLSFLRGVNVGGHTVKMETLRQLFSDLGLTHVRSYIQSGNISFETVEPNRAALTRKIEAHLSQSLGFEVPVFLRTPAEVEQALQLDPFQHMEVTPDMRLFILFLSEPLPVELILPLHSPGKDFEIVQTTTGEAFVVLRLVNGRPGNPVGFIEKTFQVQATSRFFATTQKILQSWREA